MLSNSCTLYEVFIILCLPSIYGQTIQPHHLCSDVSAPAGSSGVVEYLQGETNTSCTLILTGLASGSYVSIPGVNSETSQPCPSVIINSQSYCIKGTDYGQSVIIQLVNNYLNFTATSQTPNSMLHYYNQVATCDVDINLPAEPSVDQLTGILTTSYEPMQETDVDKCNISIHNIPNPSVTVQFELLNSYGLAGSIGVSGPSFRSTDAPSSTVLFTARTDDPILVEHLQGNSESHSFLIRFRFLRCGDIPEIPYTIPHATGTSLATPWLPRAAVTYECLDGWELKSDTVSAIECIVDRNREIAVWTNHSNIQCIQERIACHRCYYNNLSTNWFGNQRPSQRKNLLKVVDERLMEKCGNDDSNLEECPEGVTTCGLSVTEEFIRLQGKSRIPVNDLNEGIIVVSHFCAHYEDRKSGCNKYGFTGTGGMQVSCICRGSGCNGWVNTATTLSLAFVPMLLLGLVALISIV